MPFWCNFFMWGKSSFCFLFVFTPPLLLFERKCCKVYLRFVTYGWDTKLNSPMGLSYFFVDTHPLHLWSHRSKFYFCEIIRLIVIVGYVVFSMAPYPGQYSTCIIFGFSHPEYLSIFLLGQRFSHHDWFVFLHPNYFG